MPQLAARPRLDWAFLHLGATHGLERDSKWRVAGENAAGALRCFHHRRSQPAIPGESSCRRYGGHRAARWQHPISGNIAADVVLARVAAKH